MKEKNVNNLKIFLSRVTALSLIPFVLTGCGKKAECDIPTRHVHKYTKQINDNISIYTYLDNEEIYTPFSNFERNDEYLEINRDDEKFYHTLNGLIEGTNNWDFIFHEMSTKEDFLEYYYEYYTTETYTETDNNGNSVTKTRRVHHCGWTTNKNNSDNTGKVRLNHPRFYGYRIVQRDNDYYLEKSKAVDDVREIIYDYPYYDEKFTTYVTKTFKVWKHELRSLKVDDPKYNDFDHPNLNDSSIDLLKKKK